MKWVSYNKINEFKTNDVYENLKSIVTHKNNVII